MAFTSLDGSDDAEPLAEINMVPLIDVMLVLLIIFIVTAPLLTHSVKVALPQASSAATVQPPRTAELSIDASQRMFWNGEAVDEPALRQHLVQAGNEPEVPSLHLRIDRSVDYGQVARVMSWAAAAGVTKLGFLTEPAEPDGR